MAALGHGCGRAHAALAAYDPPPPSAPLWAPIGLVRAAALGYRSLAADGAWLAAIAHFGDRAMHARGYPALAPLLARTVGLDPDFVAAYVFAGTALTVNDMDVQPALTLLAAGARRRGDDWRIPFLLGFDAYTFAHDDALGARALAQAAQVSGAPPHLGLLAARLAARAGSPELGIALLDTLLTGAPDDATAASFRRRRQLLQLEVDLQRLDAALARYRALRGAPAEVLADLVVAGILPALPDDPLGGAYCLGADGQAHTHHEAARLAGGRGDREGAAAP